MIDTDVENPDIFAENKEFIEKIVNNNFDKPDLISDYMFKNMVHRKSERNVLLFNHPEFLKA